MNQGVSRTIFEDVKNQTRIWKLGHYDYLDSGGLAKRYEYCAQRISEHFDEQISVLDIAAGTGGTLPYIIDIVKEYTYTDISAEAGARFQEILLRINNWSGTVNMHIGDVSDISFGLGYDVVFGLGLSRYTMEPKFFRKLIDEGVIVKGGLMILEATAASGSLDYYGESLPDPISEHVLIANGDVAEVVRRRLFKVYAI